MCAYTLEFVPRGQSLYFAAILRTFLQMSVEGCELNGNNYGDDVKILWQNKTYKPILISICQK